ncbi:ANKRD36C [Symbiodinium natans]|uniref:ANKRD36C protein n=1 Tax=Symbiodinium natans TaxID=878477 RepID=A0A812U108_9DINO|nr:ANKRD36C [Symbiodinium natans]
MPGTMYPGTVMQGAPGTDYFTMMDTNNDGVVSRDEFAAAMRSGGVQPVGDAPMEPVQGGMGGMGQTNCPACGNVYMDDSLFCRKCGRKRDA